MVCSWGLEGVAPVFHKGAEKEARGWCFDSKKMLFGCGNCDGRLVLCCTSHQIRSVDATVSYVAAHEVVTALDGMDGMTICEIGHSRSKPVQVFCAIVCMKDSYTLLVHSTLKVCCHSAILPLNATFGRTVLRKQVEDTYKASTRFYNRRPLAWRHPPIPWVEIPSRAARYMPDI